jgi:hypothetical protein
MKKETFNSALSAIDESVSGKTVKYDVHFKSAGQTARLINVTLEKLTTDLYKSTDNIGKEWYFSVEDVLMISKFNQ